MIIMAPTLGQAGFRIGFFILVTSGGLLLVLDRDSAEFVLMAFMFVVGLLFVGGVALMVKLTERKRR